MYYWSYNIFFLYSADCLAYPVVCMHTPTSETTVQEEVWKYSQSRQVIFTTVWVHYLCEYWRILYHFCNFQDASESYCFRLQLLITSAALYYNIIPYFVEGQSAVIVQSMYCACIHNILLFITEGEDHCSSVKIWKKQSNTPIFNSLLLFVVWCPFTL